MLLEPDLRGRDQSVGDGQHPGFPVAMPTTIDWNGFQAGIDGGEMGTGGNAGLAQYRRGQQPAEPGRMLKDGQFVPGIEGDDGLQHRWQVFDLAHHAAPFVEPRIFIPVEIIDHRIFFCRAGTAWPRGTLDRRLRTGEHRIDGGIVDAREIFDVVDIFPLPFRIFYDRAPDDTHRVCRFTAGRRDLRGLPERPKPVGGKSPAGELRGNAPAGAQHVAGDCQLVGGCANISDIVMEDEVFEMDQFAVDPQRGTGVGEMGPFYPSLADR
jgi:hypothetical protein